MSAIAGFLHRSGEDADPHRLARMAEALERWGPDAVGTRTCGPVGLAQRMLRTTPEDRCGPIESASSSGALLVVADARLDNRRELGSALGMTARETAAASDGTLILRAYERWGGDFPARLLGDFAIAIWDAPRRTLLCARDPIGVRPLYYSLSDELFAFGTQIEAILALPQVPRRLDETTLGDYLALLPPDKERTFYAGIRRLHPGSVIEVSPDRVERRSYWALDESRELRLGSDAEYAEAFKATFAEAVRARLHSSSPVGAMLSGGLDSSSIVCTAREMLDPGSRLITLSGTFPSFRSDEEARVDEKRFIEMVVAGGGVEPHYIPADRTSPLFDFLWSGEEPLPAASLYMDWAVLQAAREQGVRVILSGNDGDSVVGYGRAYLVELAWTGRWRTLLRELYALSRRYGVGRRDIVAQRILPTLVPAPLAAALESRRMRDGPIFDPRSVVRRDFAQRVGVVERARAARLDDRPRRREREVHRMNIDSPMLTLMLEVFGRTAAAFSVEPRYPFLDRRVMELCLSMPGHQKLYQGWDRTVMRRAMDGLLPKEIQWQGRKQNLKPNFNLRLAASRDLLDDAIHGTPDVLEPYVDMEALRSAYERYLAEPGRGNRDSFTVFWTAVFGLWLRHSKLTP